MTERSLWIFKVANYLKAVIQTAKLVNKHIHISWKWNYYHFSSVLWFQTQGETKDLIRKFAKQMREGGLITQHK